MIHKQQKFGQKKDTGKRFPTTQNTHQNKTIQLTLAIRSKGPGS